MLTRKAKIILLTVGLKKVIAWMSGYFRKSRPLWGIVKVEVNLSNYAKKADIKKGNRCWYIKIC